MKYKDLPEWAQAEIRRDILAGRCDCCEERHKCHYQDECEQAAEEIAEGYGEAIGYALIRRHNGHERIFPERLDFVNEEDEIMER